MPMANEDDEDGSDVHSLVITNESNFRSLLTLRMGCNQLTTFPPSA